jgi:hypothetical protein
MTITETANKVVSSLGGYPMLLALIVVNVLFLAGLFWALNKASDQRQKQFEMIMAHCISKVATPP